MIMATGPNNLQGISAADDVGTVRSRHGRTIAILGLFVGAFPSCLVLYWLGEAFIEFSGSPTTSWRPLLLVMYGMGLSVLNAVGCIPFPLMAERFGTRADAELALRCLYF